MQKSTEIMCITHFWTIFVYFKTILPYRFAFFHLFCSTISQSNNNS